MKIAMLTNNYKPFIAGVPISIERLAAGLRERGHTVYIFAPSYPNAEEEEFVIRYPVMSKSLEGEVVIPKIFSKTIEKEIRKLEIDLIHVHHPFLVGNIALTLKRKYHIPVVFTYHTRYEQYLHYLKPYQALLSDSKKRSNGWIKKTETEILDLITDKIIPSYTRYYSNKCNTVIAPTFQIKKYLLDQKVKSAISILPTGINLGNWEEGSSKVIQMKKEQKIKELKIQDVKIEEQIQEIKDLEKLYCKKGYSLFTTVQRLGKEKNIEFQIRGLEILKNKYHKKFQFLIIGDGPEKDNLKALSEELGLSKQIHFIGKIPNDKIRNYHKISEAFLFSSRSETQGIVLLEAMAEGKPVIALEGTGVSDIVRNGFNGYLIDDDMEQWTKQIAKMIDDEKLLKKLGKGAKQTAQSYGTCEIASKAEVFYLTTLKEEMERKLLSKYHPFKKEIVV